MMKEYFMPHPIRNTLYASFLLCYSLSLAPAYTQDTKAIDTEMQNALEQVASGSVPGISVAIASPDGVVWSGAAGYSNIEDRHPVSQTHLFGIGDITSQYIATVIMKMAEDGIIDLNHTPRDILGDTVEGIANADSANLYQLLNQTSGIYSWADDADWARRGRGVQMNPKYLWRRDEQLKYITHDLHPAVHSPGEDYAYSKSNVSLLGLIIEKLTGGPVELEVKSRILNPLNLKNTYFDSFEEVPAGSLVGSYHLASDDFISKVGINSKFEFGLNRLIDTSGASLSSEGLAGGIVTSARELALFSAALWSGKILSGDDFEKISPAKINGQIGLHSEILGFTADIRKIEGSELVIVSFINLGAVNSGENDVKSYLDSYLDKIILPIAEKYAK